MFGLISSLATVVLSSDQQRPPAALVASDDVDVLGPAKLALLDAERVQDRHVAQAAAAAQSEPNPGPTDNIELPDINSEYSDSDDEDRGRDVADWAQSPDLARMLRVQSTINPDDIFGEIRPLRMEEMFKTRQSRFRARTSSANWTGTDRLTVEEEAQKSGAVQKSAAGPAPRSRALLVKVASVMEDRQVCCAPARVWAAAARTGVLWRASAASGARWKTTMA